MGGAAAVKAVPKKDAKAKVPTKKKAKVPVPTRYFGFIEHTDVKDLAAEPLKIGQLVQFIPKDADDNPVDSLDVTLTIKEMRVAKSGERADYKLAVIKGKVTKADEYNFSVTEITQDPAQVPTVKKPKAGSGAELFMTSKLKIVGVDGKERGKSGLELVLPPMEYDETLELSLDCDIAGSVKGEAKVTFSTYDAMLAAAGITPVDRKSDYPFFDGRHNGNMHHVTLHCMCNILAAPDPNDAFDIDGCLNIFKVKHVSAHYIIDRDGTVVQAIDVHNVASHAWSPQNTFAHGLHSANQQSLGIEMMGIADGFREDKLKQYEKAKKKFADKKAPLEADKKVLEDALAKREGEKAAGKKKVKVGREEVDVDVAIERIKAAITAQQAKIDAVEPDPFIEQWDTFTAATDTDGVPLVYKYTDAQYKALAAMLEVVSRRFGYLVVSSHHFIIPAAKTDPGIFFDWARVTPHLLPGTLSDDESGDGGVYLVKI